MWPMGVVVSDVAREDVVEVATAEDQELVEALAADAADPPLGVRPRLWRPHGCPDNPDLFGAEHLVELSGELAVAVTDKKEGRMPSSSSCISRLRACWVTHGPSGFVVIPARCTRRVASSMKKRT